MLNVVYNVLTRYMNYYHYFRKDIMYIVTLLSLLFLFVPLAHAVPLVSQEPGVDREHTRTITVRNAAQQEPVLSLQCEMFPLFNQWFVHMIHPRNQCSLEQRSTALEIGLRHIMQECRTLNIKNLYFCRQILEDHSMPNSWVNSIIIKQSRFDDDTQMNYVSPLNLRTN